MTQVATVERILDKTHAEISVPRKSARPGQKVVVESSTSKMMHIIALVYLTPVALFLLCYLLAVAFGAGVTVQYSLAAVGFAAGIAIAIAYDRRLKKQGGLIFRIVRLF